MRYKRIVTISIICIFAILIFKFVKWVNEDEFAVPELPIKSIANTITVTSNGCCLWAENVKLTLENKNGNKTVLSSTDKVYEYDIFTYEIAHVESSPIRLILELSVFYSDECKFDEKIIEFENIDELKKNGILIYIQEADGAYVNAISSDYHVSYKLSYEQPYIWTKLDEPNVIYP